MAPRGENARSRSAVAVACAAVWLPRADGVSYNPWSTTTAPPPQGYVCGQDGATVAHLMRRDSVKEKEVLPGWTHLGDHFHAVQEEYTYDMPRGRTLPNWFNIHEHRMPRNTSHDPHKEKGLDIEMWSYPIGNYSFLDQTEDWRSPIDAVQCSGRSCQFLSVHFSKYRNLTKDADYFTPWIGRKGRGNAEAKCGEGRVVSSIQCHGDDCSSFRLTCGVPDQWAVTRDDIEMGEFTSKCEQAEFSTCGGLHGDAWKNYVMYGVRCTTPSCSHMRLLCKRVKEPTVDCEWGPWTLFGHCSQTCGSGWMVRTRTVAKYASFDGDDCRGPSHERQQCNAFTCDY